MDVLVYCVTKSQNWMVVALCIFQGWSRKMEFSQNAPSEQSFRSSISSSTLCETKGAQGYQIDGQMGKCKWPPQLHRAQEEKDYKKLKQGI